MMVDWCGDDSGLGRMPMVVHRIEGAYLLMSWPSDAELEQFGIPLGVESGDFWPWFHKLTFGVFEDLGERSTWVHSDLVRAMRPIDQAKGG